MLTVDAAAVMYKNLAMSTFPYRHSEAGVLLPRLETKQQILELMSKILNWMLASEAACQELRGKLI